eukprot:CAMPEP_0114352518 /NCGR_PEP_ID=MMETSP0101-20121206/18006_1 /TAXON_ID=38822 ORGANISM="Pteridomonas danica, Strain PT" /NCGR_SAMPLE_ID=MMETSP0101 /ASSEMBLY_ACC=CAM_ASM_000211 /LENGTH=288 /DNA_ID=CAMNT_0001492959 /DNA_START=91 /DNA_END=957 /DNA_ORIENTATION=-
MTSLLIWPLILIVPLILTYNSYYEKVFDRQWYDPELNQTRPSPLGLTLGLVTVAIGQIFTIIYHFLHVRVGLFGEVRGIHKDGVENYDFWTETKHHLAQPEGFVILGLYLIGTWMVRLMPDSYYQFEGGIDWVKVLMQLLLQDAIQCGMHILEHEIDKILGTKLWFYRKSHKPHHRFISPKYFDAFNGSVADTFFMILVPLFITKSVIHTNVWSYMAFGTLYANWLCLIHSEVQHPWDGVFTLVGFGTAADHHVHHQLFNFNYGHLFTYTDRICSTYKAPSTVNKFTI